MVKRVKSNLKHILDEKGITIRQLEAIMLEKYGDKGVKFETIRRLYNDTTMQYQRESIGKLCEVLNVPLSELLILVDQEESETE